MSKKILFTVLCLQAIATVSLQAQIMLGAKAGANYSTMILHDDNGTPYLNFSQTPGFHLGASANHPLADWLWVRGELLYSLKGAKFTALEGDVRKGRFSVHQVNLPFMVTLYPINRLFVRLGGELGATINTRHELLEPGHWRDFGALAGIGFEFTNQIGAELRWVEGIAANSHTRFVGTGITYEVRETFNRCWQFSLEYRFGEKW